MKNVFQSLFFHWCQGCYFSSRTAYMIYVLSLIWLMKRIWSNDVTIAPREKYNNQLRQWYHSVLIIYLMLQSLDTLSKFRRTS